MHTQLVIDNFQINQSEAENNISFSGGQFTLASPIHSSGSVSFTAFDSGEYGFKWGRLSFDADIPLDSQLRVFASADDIEPIPGGAANIFTLQGTGADLLLNVTGRYLSLQIELISGDNFPTVYAMRLYMSGDHMIDYLPEIYRTEGGDFTKRFISVFDSSVSDLERDIYHLSSKFDYNTAAGDSLQRLADWVGVTAKSDSQCRNLISAALDDYETMYTVDGIKRSVQRFTGAEPLIIEYAAISPNARDCPDSELYRKLYGDNPFRFFILLDTNTFSDRADREHFIERMENYIPAGMEFETVMLRHSIRLDNHSYLGVNSYVDDLIPAALTGNITLTNYVVLSG